MSELNGSVTELRRASREVVRELGFMQNNCVGTGVTHSESHALMELERHGTLTIAGLAELLRLDKSTTSRLAGVLVKKGWAEVVETSSDKRRKPLTLTRKGMAVVGSI